MNVKTQEDTLAIDYTILHNNIILLSVWRDVKTKKSGLKNETTFDLNYKLYNKFKKKT